MSPPFVLHHTVWSNMYAEDAPETLHRLFEEEAKVSKSSKALANNVKMMTQAEDNATMHYRERLAA